jgi:hypothetical protein
MIEILAVTETWEVLWLDTQFNQQVQEIPIFA